MTGSGKTLPARHSDSADDESLRNVAIIACRSEPLADSLRPRRSKGVPVVRLRPEPPRICGGAYQPLRRPCCAPIAYHRDVNSIGDGAEVSGKPLDVRTLYRQRFEGEQKFRNAMWRVLCNDWFQRFIGPDDTVLDVGAGHCEFINNIVARRRIAVDLNEETHQAASEGVEVVTASSEDLTSISAGSIDVAFVSNFFEHLSRPAILATLEEVHRVLKRGGRLLILQPNIRYCGRDYWMFFDHVTPLDDRSLSEALGMTGFDIERCIARFLPFTTKSSLPRSLFLLRVYLRLPLFWRIFGGQAFIVAVR
jgi:SAM-dependent methyltransferase